MPKQSTESDLYEQIARYIRNNYPRVPFHFDLSGVNNPSPRTRSLYSRLNGRAWPDLFIPVCRIMPDGRQIGGCFLEIKREGTRLNTKSGKWASAHIAEQADVLEQLANAGYVATFAVGLDEAKTFIDSYLIPAWEPPAQDYPLPAAEEVF